MSQEVRNFAIQQVELGNPVLLSIGGNFGGHVVVAYDFSPSLNKLYCNMGWSASYTHKTPEEAGFSRYKTALAINFNESHSHTNNYGVTEVNGNVPFTNYYCYDSASIHTFDHVHSYTDHYAFYSSTKHKAYCSCGAYILESHASNGTSYLHNGHNYTNCIDCGALIDLNTTPIIVAA